MFFDHYPYTNFHNVNLDWVLQAVKAWGQTVEANDRAFRDLKEANEDFKNYVRNYLQNLDITDEINTKLDNMLASGILTPYFAPYVKGYVDSWLASHVTPTSPALDSTLTLSGAAARADSTGHRLKDLAYIDALSTPEIIAALNRSQVLPGYRVQGIAYDYNGHYYVCGGSVDETGTGVIVKMTKPDFTDAEITEIPQLGHANDITYYDGYLYVCTVGGGNAPQWGIYKINVNDFTDKTLISNAPENTIGISYRQGDFWILAPYRIYRTTDFTSYEVVVANTNDLLTAYGIPTSGRISQTIFRAAGYLIGWVCSFVFEDRHYGALTFFSASGEPIAFKMFPAYHTEIQGAVYADMSIYLLADGNMVNVFRMDPRHLSYVQLKAGDDLNSFTGRGTLYSTGSNVSAELLNSPSSGEGFTVQVDRLGVYNTIQTARTNSGRELYRIKSFNSDTWGEWIEPAAEVAQIKEDLNTKSPDLHTYGLETNQFAQFAGTVNLFSGRGNLMIESAYYREPEGGAVGGPLRITAAATFNGYLVRVKPNTSYIMGELDHRLYFYDADFIYLGRTNNSDIVDGGPNTCTTPQKCYWMSLTFRKTRDLSTWMLLEGDTYPDTYISGYPRLTFIPKDPAYLTNKRIAFFGDSITAGTGTNKTFHEYIGERYGFTCLNYGYGGSGYVTSYSGTVGRHGIGEPGIGIPNSENSFEPNNVLTRLAEPDPATLDGVVIFAGTNDWSHRVELTDFSAKLDETFTYYQTNYGAVPLVVMLPIHRLNDTAPDGKTMMDYCNIIVQKCREYGIPYVDTLAMSGLQPNNTGNRNVFFPRDDSESNDGIHPNHLGHERIMRVVGEVLNGLVKYKNDVMR